MTSGTTRRSFLVGGLSTAGMAFSGGAYADATRLAVYFSHGTLSFEAAAQFCDIATTAAGGALSIEPDAAHSLMPPLNAIARSSPLAYYHAPSASEPLFRLSVLPMLTSSLEEAETLLRIARPYYSAALARHGQVLLAAQPWRPGTLWSRRTVRAAADITGQAFNVPFNTEGWPSLYSTEGWDRLLERLGATFAPASADLLLVPGTSGARYALTHKNVAEVFVAAQLDFMTASRDFLASLPVAQQQQLLAAAQKWEAARWRSIRELILLDQDDAAAAGVTIVTDPPKVLMDALRAAAEPGIQSWLQSAGADGTEIVTSYRRAIGRG
jgi:TRAP-type C4-dicarboxylate transport system substrate-binding protein